MLRCDLALFTFFGKRCIFVFTQQTVEVEVQTSMFRDIDKVIFLDDELATGSELVVRIFGETLVRGSGTDVT